MIDRDSYYNIKTILDRLEKEGVEVLYNEIKHWKMSNGSSLYSALNNDLVACCPSAEQWKNPRLREIFKLDIKSYCNHYLSFVEDNK